MDSSIAKKFQFDAEKVGFDRSHRNIINNNISKYDIAVERGKKQYSNLELAKKRASRLKFQAENDLETYLVDFESNVNKNGGTVLWAVDDKDAIELVKKIAKTYSAKVIVKSKSMTTEEIDFNEHIEKEGYRVVETDLGEYIVQIDEDKPYHIVTPAMHKSKELIAELFNRKFGTPIDSTPEQITNFVRHKLRDDFINADIGITGANFLIADTGAIALTENEGNGLLSMSMPRIHIVIAGIEKIIPSITDLDLFWSLLSTHGTGQNITVYNSIVSGPRKENETDGPEKMFVILLDNGRSTLLAKEEQREALNCIRCGACLNGCPVYKNIGGHTYNTTYSGPIGSVISPHFKGMEDFKHLSFASSLCGKCTEVCPVNIHLHKLLLINRRDSVDEKLSGKVDNMIMTSYKKVMLKRSLLDMATPMLKNLALNMFFKKHGTPARIA